MNMMRSTFVSESITPIGQSFDTARMAQGEPGVPRQFRWRKKEFTVAEVLDSWRECGDCKHGSGERYVRKHGYRLRTTDGLVLKVYFQRKFGRVQRRCSSRWWIFSIEQREQRDATGCAWHPITLSPRVELRKWEREKEIA